MMSSIIFDHPSIRYDTPVDTVGRYSEKVRQETERERETVDRRCHVGIST
jgi:hypothetical protein